jgi:serpin B
MVIFLPDTARSIETVENNLDSKYYTRIIAALSPGRVKLELPKFKITSEFELSQVLSAMGMPDVFGAADFSGITNEKLYVNAIIHKAFINVSEEGTEAAAATGIIMKMTAVYPFPKTHIFIANHPFIFIIKDNATGGILFMGKIIDPPKE